MQRSSRAHLVPDKLVTILCTFRKPRAQVVEASLAALLTAMTLPEEITCLFRVSQLTLPGTPVKRSLTGGLLDAFASKCAQRAWDSCSSPLHCLGQFGCRQTLQAAVTATATMHPLHCTCRPCQHPLHSSAGNGQACTKPP